jgi:hypothetical protein
VCRDVVDAIAVDVHLAPSRSDSKYSAPFCGRSQRTAPMFTPLAASFLPAILVAMNRSYR